LIISKCAALSNKIQVPAQEPPFCLNMTIKQKSPVGSANLPGFEFLPIIFQ